MEVSVTQFKAKCLGIIDKVQREKCTVIIFKHGRPAAELVPITHRTAGTFFGRSFRNTVIIGDLLGTGESWDAAH